MNVVQELNGTTPVANLLTSLGIDEVLQRTDAAGARSFLTDGLGSTLALTDSAGLMQSEYTYEPFGKTTATGVASANAFKYTGREDDGTGLYYYRARYYHPVLQRFVSEDPIGFDGGDANLYAYVGNEPVNAIDPLGLIRCSINGCDFDGFDDGVGGGAGGGVGGGRGGSSIKGGGVGGGGGKFRPLSPREIKKLKDAGYDIHDLKGGKHAAHRDLYCDQQGNVSVHPKGGGGPGEPTGINLNDFK